MKKNFLPVFESKLYKLLNKEDLIISKRKDAVYISEGHFIIKLEPFSFYPKLVGIAVKTCGDSFMQEAFDNRNLNLEERLKEFLVQCTILLKLLGGVIYLTSIL